MSIPVATLLAFATWTVLLLLFTVGIYRWSRILTRRAGPADFPADQIEGEDWYKRSMRAHANCVENLPVFGAIVFALTVSMTGSPTTDVLCVVVVIARVLQSLTHVAFVQGNRVVSIRFTFFLIQILCFLMLIWVVARGMLAAG